MMSIHLDAVLADVHDAGLDALLVSTPANTYYVSGFRAITYSRPVLVVASDSPLLLIPELEVTHARATSVIPAIRTYADTGLGGLRGKSTLQVAIDHCVDASVPRTTEIEIMAHGDAAMLLEAARRHPDYHVTAGSRPVSGEKSVLPHSIPSGRSLRQGDVVIHGTGCTTDGYYSEDERTIFIGPPTDHQRQVFEVMRRAQQAALDSIRPGVTCQQVDRAARRLIEEAGFGRAFIHRTGHGIGIDIHELPFFAPSDETVLQAGMVMSVEPGIYVDGVGGFRHSDTVIVTSEGREVLTKFPKTLPDLIVA